MATERTNPANERDMNMNKLEGRSSIPGDLPDSPEDSKKLQPEETTINLPDVKDIPGQEFVNAPSIGEMADTTASSSDEEGDSIFERDDSRGFSSGNDADVRPDELQALRDTTYMPTRDEDNLRQARMDNVDFQGEPLNEESFGEGQRLSASDLDTDTEQEGPQSDAMDDEENRDYSVEDTDRDQPNENRTGA